MTRSLLSTALAVAGFACAHGRSPEERGLIAGKDCNQLLRAADQARAGGDADAASDLAGACPKDRLLALVASKTPAEGLLLCGRSAAADHKACDARTLEDLKSRLQPHLTLGPSDEEVAMDPLIALALDVLGKELNISWNASDPDVIVGKLQVSIEHAKSNTVATVSDAEGNQKHVPAIQHRFVAKAAAQVELGDKTRVLRAQDEARDVTWETPAHLAVPAKPEPQVPDEHELKKRAAIAWLRSLGKALAATPPETVDLDDERGCVAYGLALNASAGNDAAAAQGQGDPDRVAACEKLLGEPPGAGIPVP